jgi:hypothetical protein
MAEDNSTNLPILDDIITPGDADKAVQRPSRKEQSSLWEDGPTDLAAAESIAEEDLPVDLDQQVEAEALAEQAPAADASDLAETQPSPAADSAPVLDQTVTIELPADAVAASRPHLDRETIATLTDEIIISMTPEIERILREKIRQILAHRFSGSPDHGRD